MITNEIPLIQKTYELYKMFYGYLLLFPKKDKYTIGAKCETYILITLELLLAASNAPRLEKRVLLKQASIKFDTLKVLVRLTHDVRALDSKKYIAIQKVLHEIGRMLGGWQRSLNV